MYCAVMNVASCKAKIRQKDNVKLNDALIFLSSAEKTITNIRAQEIINS
jgi:hypothetical protein